jgi:hypothetical protein
MGARDEQMRPTQNELQVIVLKKRRKLNADDCAIIEIVRNAILSAFPEQVGLSEKTKSKCVEILDFYKSQTVSSGERKEVLDCLSELRSLPQAWTEDELRKAEYDEITSKINTMDNRATIAKAFFDAVIARLKRGGE